MTGIGRQEEYGSPVNDAWQVQKGRWLVTRHSASIPQSPGQGSMHLERTQVFEDEQSELSVHSGLQAT